ncbi:F3H9.20 protein [Striga asiatica]|uniref:F3H9.20 protein n=1 Tax=Striga asiatica TaxID=4170 RepID=A0A5A7PFA9_STRAF|nr:F3H9.20 protein [Striga asiatica]
MATPLILPLCPKPLPKSVLQLLHPSPSNSHIRFSRGIRCRATGQAPQSTAVYQGVYGPWKIESADVQEVILYRFGLVTAASCFVAVSSTAFLDWEALDLIRRNSDLISGFGACGLGLSLYLIHIYVTEIKRTLQALWLIGAVGSLGAYAALARPAGKYLVDYVVENPSAVWFVGPLFAALTGLVFKEGLCYGKLEAGVLTFIIPSVLLGHLTGLMDESTKLTLLGVWMALFVVFAGRKFSQPIKDDIGDKSVFIFNAMSEEEKAALLEKLEQNYSQNLD